MSVKKLIKAAIGRAVPDRYLLSRVSGEGAGIVLTFDDGPDPAWTRASLEALSEANVQATYFLVGQQAERYPDIVKEIVAAGHTIGDHTYSHCDVAALRARELDREVIDNLKRLSDLSGQNVDQFRPPWGRIGLRGALYLMSKGVQIVMWSVDSKDYLKSGAHDIVDGIDRVGLRAGDIVLLHDDNAFTIEALPMITKAARGRGLTFGNLKN